MQSYAESSSVFTVSTYTAFSTDTYKALVAWGEEYGDLVGFYEPPSECDGDLCTVTNSVIMEM